jgi:nucleoside-diphosphate-sugar epimerase
MIGEKIVVYGAASPLGRRVLDALRANQHINAVAADRLNREALRTAVRDADMVINATMGAPAVISFAAERLFEALRAEAPTRPLVHISSMTVYGNAIGLCDESTPAAEPTTKYAAAHIAAESKARRFPQTVILRPGCEYGPDCKAWSGRVAAWLAHRRIGDLGAGGDGYCNLVFIDDLVRAVLAAMRSPAAAGRVFNVAMAGPPTWNEYLIAYAIALGATPVRRMTRRRWTLETRLLAPPLKVAELTIGRFPFIARQLPPPIPPSFSHLCAQEIRLDVAAVEVVLGLKWTPLEVGLQAAAAAYGGVVRH